MANNILKHPRINLLINIVLSLLIAINGFYLIFPVLINALFLLPDKFETFNSWENTLSVFDLFEIPQFALGCALIFAAIGLTMRTRAAWFFSLIILFFTCTYASLTTIQSHWLMPYSFTLILVLILRFKFYNKHSIIAGSYFALTGMILLLFYSVFGVLYMGSQFKPALTDMPSAFYFSLVTMSTVGYGDIVPYTQDARFFTLTVIILGITFFTASLSGVISFVTDGGFKQIIHSRRIQNMRNNHYIIAGASPLAISLYQGLKDRKMVVTVIVNKESAHTFPTDTDIVIGDPSNTECLLKAGANKAKYILALRNDDSDNVFIILAAKEVIGEQTKIISLVNSSSNLQKIKRVQPDMLFSLQLLGSELLIRTLNNDPIDNKLVTDLFFGHIDNK